MRTATRVVAVVVCALAAGALVFAHGRDAWAAAGPRCAAATAPERCKAAALEDRYYLLLALGVGGYGGRPGQSLTTGPAWSVGAGIEYGAQRVAFELRYLGSYVRAPYTRIPFKAHGGVVLNRLNLTRGVVRPFLLGGFGVMVLYNDPTVTPAIGPGFRSQKLAVLGGLRRTATVIPLGGGLRAELGYGISIGVEARYDVLAGSIRQDPLFENAGFWNVSGLFQLSQ